MTNHRAYSLLEWKTVDEDKRLIEGIATTPSVDRVGDVVETAGVEFKLPLPLLWQHDSRQPIGNVVEAKVTKDGIRIKASIAPAGIDEDIDRAWRKIKAGLVRGLSIGFRSLEETFDKTIGGFRFVRSEWMELSVVTIAANQQASILTVKSADLEALAALGHKRNDVVRLATPPGVSGQTISPTGIPKMTIQEQIAAFEAKRAASVARMETLMTKASDQLSALEDEESREYDGLDTEVKSIDEHIARLKKHEATMLAKATPVGQPANPDQAAAVRRSEPPTVKSNAPKGILPARMAIAMYKGGNVPEMAATIAKRLWPDTPEVELTLRAAVEAGDTTTSGWASQLVPSAQSMMDDFLGLLRPATILGRIPGLRNVPFNIAIPIETASGTVGWVGEGAGKPVGALTFTSATLRWAKAAGIVVITEELARFSQPSADVIIRDSMIKTLGRFFDTQFVGSAAEVSNVSPAGILNGISATSTTGTTPAAFRTDIATLIGKFITNNVDPSGLVLLMSATQALRLGLMNTDLGVKLFPGISVRGGEVEGFPVIVSENVGTKIIALNANEILIAEDNGIRVDVSREATVEMESTPAVGESSPITTLGPLKSLWQNNLVGFRVERYITWKRGRDSAVEYLNANAYVA